MTLVSFAEVPSLHRLTRYWGQEFCNSGERGMMLRPRELLKHIFVRKPVVWSGGETYYTLWMVEQY